MDWNFQVYFFIFSGFQSVEAFNIEPTAWKEFSPNQNIIFGYKVVQKDPLSVIVSDPLFQQSENKRGQVYSCAVKTGKCSPLQINVPPEAVNMSLGLSMTRGLQPSKLLVCGPTIPKACKVTTTFNGMCFIHETNVPESPIPRALRDCPRPAQTDIAFLLDASGSVLPNQFKQMLTFVVKLIQGLINRDIQFAVAQFSTDFTIEISFNDFRDFSQIMNIKQKGGGTYTARAINKLVNELFTSRAGSRANANRVLIVITDGESSYGDDNLKEAIENAKRNNIIRYSIGVGKAFDTESARDELKTIASEPDDEHVFKVEDFDLLDKIRDILEGNIIAIEGTQTSGDSNKMEFAQEGFNAAFTPNGKIILSAVGAFQWKGGYQEYNSLGQASSSFQNGSEHDSYLGYSMAVGRTQYDRYVILGAPRHGHKGRVTISSLTTTKQLHLDPPEPQIGAYYGDVVGVVDLNADSYADLLLVSAPLYIDDDQEGKIFVYSFSHRSQSQVLFVQTLEGMVGQKGRFGSSVASPGDLNGDKFTDVVVGAPLEDDGQGSIYIFNGRAGDISKTFSQRISGSSILRDQGFFGLSLSEFALDHSGDGLLDIAVGTKGTVILFRSRPIVTLVTTVTYNPSKIPTKITNCEKPLENTLHLCFRMSLLSYSQKKDLSANIQYTIKLDAKRQSNRAFFLAKNRDLSGNMTVILDEVCKDHHFWIEACPEDALNPLSNELTFTFEGLPTNTMENLRPILHPSIKNTSDHNLDFEINCGNDNVCTDNLKLDFNFSGSSDIQVGIMQDLNVMVFVQNRGENSYNSHITLSYPFGLSFRKFTRKQGRVECTSLDSDQKVSLGTTTCHISKPIFRENDLAIFDITYSINKDDDFDQMVTFTATADSGNDKHSEYSELSKNRTINVKYAIYVAMIRHENSSIHINFTAGKNNLQKTVTQIFKMENDLRDLNLTFFIRVPIKVGDEDIWTNKNLQIEGCSFTRDEQPMSLDFLTELQGHHKLNCSVAKCRLFTCNTNILRRASKFYTISGNVSSGWIKQTKLKSVIFELISTATLEYDKSKYIFIPSDSAPIVKIITQVEVYEEKNILKEVVGGAVGGLLLLALITAALYKAGFFKSRYKQMLDDADTGAEGPKEEVKAHGEDSAAAQ
ncbi:integrin alpha-X-like isoform X1 [Brachyhypopomus gauderio]|uniref:integrin alpha-X-like isoform X1 n=2 Tax=Brachyhypopomus gauderio TaxID=698409 RepID=UPI00404248B4